MLVDSHCHLDFPELLSDLEGVLARAAEAGVGRMVAICTRMSREPGVRAIAEAHESVLYAAGAHPLHLHEEAPPSLADLLALAEHPRLVGIGETGLDYHYDFAAPRDMQAESFRMHIAAARETGLPLIVHTRDADDDAARILQEEYEKGPYACVLHCFTGGEALAKAALAMGFYLSISGIATFKNAEPLRKIFQDAPLDRLLVETDAPYLSPVPVRKVKRNEPAFVVHTAAMAARLKGLDEADFARATTENFHRLFSKAPEFAPEFTNA